MEKIFPVTVACYKTIYTVATDYKEAMVVVEKNLDSISFDIEDIQDPAVDSVNEIDIALKWVDGENLMTEDGWCKISDFDTRRLMSDEEIKQAEFEKLDKWLNEHGQQVLPSVNP